MTASTDPSLGSAPDDEATNRRVPVFVPIFVALVVTALVGAGDVGLVGGAMSQWATRGYLETRGTILSSAVKAVRFSGDAKKSYRLDVAYQYTVGGRTLRGARYAIGDGSSESDDTWAVEQVARLRPGVAVPVYYAPEDPSRALLRRGLDGSDLSWPLLLLPFNLLAVGMWCGVAMAGAAAPAPRGRPRLGPWAMGFVATTVAAFVLVGVMAIGFEGHPPLVVAQGAWLATFAVGAFGYLSRRLRGEPR